MGWTSAWGPAWGALCAGFFLYFPSLVLLSTVPPLSIRLSAPSPEILGRTVGVFSMVGTFGSCVGALVTGFWLVPTFPIPRLFAGSAVLAAAIALMLLPGAFRNAVRVSGFVLWAFFLFLLSSGPGFAGFSNSSRGPLIQETRESLYGRIQVLETGKGRFLFLDGILQGGQTIPDGMTIAPYTSLLETIARSAVVSPKRVLVVGLGAALLPNRFQALGARVETVELNPQMVSTAQRWFGFNPPAGDVHIEDGRRFLTEAKGPYDLIFLDAFSGEAVPGQILTVESFRRCRELLKPDGALLLNYVGYSSGSMSLVPEMILAGMRTAFGQVDVFAVGAEGSRDNLAFVARPQPGSWGSVPTDIPCPSEEAEAIRRFADHRVILREGARVFTDDWHPADWLDRENRLQWRRESLRIFREADLDRGTF